FPWYKPQFVNRTGFQEEDAFEALREGTAQSHRLSETLFQQAKNRSKIEVSLASYQPRQSLRRVSAAEVEAFYAEQTRKFLARSDSTPSQGATADRSVEQSEPFPTILSLALPGYTRNRQEALTVVGYDDGGGFHGGTSSCT